MISHKSTTTFAILGAGSWGTALALHLSRLGHTIRLWTLEPTHANAMRQDGSNQLYLPNHAFPSLIHPTANLEEAVNNIETIIIAVPSMGYRSLLTNLRPLLHSSIGILTATKGMEPTGQLLHQVNEEILGKNIPFACLSGPSFAHEVAAGLPTAIVIASKHSLFAQTLLSYFNSSRFRVYLSADIIGVEIGGIVKNVLAIATGISDGMGFGANARCALITRGLAEISRLGMALGGQSDTFNGLTGLGDLVLTCTDNHSRNRRFGLGLGQGKNPITVENEIGQVIEGKRNAELIVRLAEKSSVEIPIVEAVCNILKGKFTAQEAMENLFSRAPRAE